MLHVLFHQVWKRRVRSVLDPTQPLDARYAAVTWAGRWPRRRWLWPSGEPLSSPQVGSPRSGPLTERRPGASLRARAICRTCAPRKNGRGERGVAIGPDARGQYRDPSNPLALLAGNFWYRQLAFMRDDWFERLTTAFDKIVREHLVFVQVLGIP